jgi:hypothetical protein
MGMASAIEKCYSGMERTLKIMAENLDDYVPKGDTWHKSLIDQMASTVWQREPVITKDTAHGLHALRSFRHRERNSYTFDLDKVRVMELGEQVFDVMHSLKNDLTSRLGCAFPEDQQSGADCHSLKMPFNQDGHFDGEFKAHTNGVERPEDD